MKGRSTSLSDHAHVLLATLGGQPQVVTFTLDLLLQKGFPISEVIVIHPAVTHERLQHSLTCLQAEFNAATYQGTARKIQFHSHTLCLNGQPLDDICDDYHADGTLDTLHELIGKHKRLGQHIHLSVTGGRRLIALLALSVAVFNFGRHDHIWHIYTPEQIKAQADEGALMHVPPEAGIRLIKGPFVALGTHIYTPVPFAHAQEVRCKQIEAQEYKRCEQVYHNATPAQRKVLQAYSKGLDTRQVAKDLCITLATVKSHKKALLQLCRNAWSISEIGTLDYHFLQSQFAGYFHQPV
jgi:CRISPR-associated protein Csx14